MNRQIITRFAPSPTGNLHIGGARTALFNYLFARKNNGKFLMRIDNTDLERNSDASVKKIFDCLSYLNINFDNSDELYYQLDHLKDYQNLVKELLKTNNAYYCFCTKEELAKSIELQKGKDILSPKYNYKCRSLDKKEVENKLQNNHSFVVRFKVPLEKYFRFNDLVKGEISIKGSEIEDFVILRSNKIPTYNLATVYDDHALKITHIFRGAEQLYNTPKQLAIYHALKWDYPCFGHISLILGEDNKKMSKRNPNPFYFIDYLQNEGFVSDAVSNYLALLGWTPDKFQEIFNLKDLENLFDGKHLIKRPANFSKDKLLWINQQHILKKDFDILVKHCLPLLKKVYSNQVIELKLKDLIMFYAKNIKLYKDIIPLSKDVITKYYLDLLPLTLHEGEIILLKKLLQELKKLDDFDEATLKTNLKLYAKIWNVKPKEIFMFLRKIISNKEHGPAIYWLLSFWGKQRLLKTMQFQLSQNEK